MCPTIRGVVLTASVVWPNICVRSTLHGQGECANVTPAALQRCDILPDNTLGGSPEFIVIHFASQYFEMQWNLSIEDISGTPLAVLYREVPLVQR